MRRWIGMAWVWVATAACHGPGPGPGVDAAAPRAAEVHWGETTEPYPIRVGQVDPVGVNRVRGAGGGWLGLGGIYARHDTPAGVVDELLLYFRVRGPDGLSGWGGGEVRLRVGREEFSYPALSGRNLTGAVCDDIGPGAYLLVPVSSRVLERLSRASYVEGWIGTDLHFEVRAPALSRLGVLLDLADVRGPRALQGVPPDGPTPRVGTPGSGRS